MTPFTPNQEKQIKRSLARQCRCSPDNITLCGCYTAEYDKECNILWHVVTAQVFDETDGGDSLVEIDVGQRAGDRRRRVYLAMRSKQVQQAVRGAA
jgi:hypothetical protein